MRRIRIAVIDFIREDIVLILVGRPIIKTEFRPESSVITAEVICAIQIGGIALLCKRVLFVHLQEHVQIIIFIVDGRVTKLLVIIPADNITAGAAFVIVSDAVVSDLGREEIESVLFISQLFKDIIGLPRISLEEIGTILLQIRIGIQCYAVFQNPGEIFASGDNVRQIAKKQAPRLRQDMARAAGPSI